MLACKECKEKFEWYEGEEDQWMCYKCLDKETEMEEYNMITDIKNVSNREVKKIRESSCTHSKTREECLESAVWNMNAKIADLELTIDVLNEAE